MAASLAAMLRARGRVGRARVIGSSGAFAWGDGHEPERELVGVGERRLGRSAATGRAVARGRGYGGVGLIRSMRGRLTGSWARSRQGRAHVDQNTWRNTRGR